MTNIKYKGETYNKYRPTYPKKLYDIIYDFHEKNKGKFNIAVDIGTGTLAVFGYSYPIIKDNIYANEILNTFLINKLEKYMNNKVFYIRNFYRNIEFPFKNKSWHFTINDKNYDNEKISIKKNITIDEFKSYLKTLSSYTNYININNDYIIDPVNETIDNIMKIMDIKKEEETIKVEWPVVLILNNNN